VDFWHATSSTQLLRFTKNEVSLTPLRSSWGCACCFSHQLPSLSGSIHSVKWHKDRDCSHALGQMAVSTLYRAGSGSALCCMWWLCGSKTFFACFSFQVKISKNRKRAVFRGKASAYECLLGIPWHRLSPEPCSGSISEGASWHRPKLYQSVLATKQQVSVWAPLLSPSHLETEIQP